MGQKKLIKFAAIKEYENVLEYPQGMPGKWAAYFNELEKGTINIELDNLTVVDNTDVVCVFCFLKIMSC